MTTAALPCDSMRILLEIRDKAINPVGTTFWDDVTYWDQPAAPNTWQTSVVYYNAAHECRGFVLERGRQTSWDEINGANVQMELDNTSGVFSIYGSQSWPRLRQGFAVRIEARWRGAWYPLFVGTITDYAESGEPNNNTVTMTAIDLFRRLSDPIDGDYHAGTDAQRADLRIANLLTMACCEDFDQSLDTGTATMTNYATTRSLLEEIKMTSRSDCGVFFIDNDGTVVYLNRTRIYGRDTGGRAIPYFSDSCDPSTLPYAAVEPTLEDQEFGNVITASNVSQGTDSPQAGLAVDQTSIDNYGRIPWAPAQLLICNAGFVQGFADWQLSRRSNAFYRVNSFECYPIHDDRIWDALLPMRIGDPLQISRTPPESQAIYAVMLCDGMRIEATPDMWKFTVRCAPAAESTTTAVRWNSLGVNWDEAHVWV